MPGTPTRRGLVRASLLIALASGAVPGGQAPAAPDALRWRVSSEDLRLRLAEQPAITWQTGGTGGGEVIEIDPAKTFQTILGLGSSLEPATCSNFWRDVGGNVRRRSNGW